MPNNFKKQYKLLLNYIFFKENKKIYLPNYPTFLESENLNGIIESQ